MAPSKPTRLACPICGKENDYLAEPLGPFCSARCKTIDLGKWLDAEYRVSEPLRPDHFAEYEDLAEGDLNQPPEK